MQTMDEQKHVRLLRAMTEASSAVHSARSIEETLQVVTDQAREIGAAHQSMTSLTADHNRVRSVSAVSFSQKYAQWRTYGARPDDSGIDSQVRRATARCE